MSHLIDLDGVREKLYILINLSLVGNSFANKYSIGIEEYQNYFSDEDYYNLTKSIVSNYSIETAIKLRSLIETLRKSNIDLKFNKEVSCFYPKEKSSNDISKQKRHDLNFICNKIIHATHFSLDTVSSMNQNPNIKWWEGSLTLEGKSQGKKGKPWSLFFYIHEYCESAIAFINDHKEEILKSQRNSLDYLIFKK